MRSFRLLLLPFSWLYGLVLTLRHFLYDTGVFKVYTPKQKTIVVGNLSLGGTGKTPMVNYLIQTLGEENVAVLSRGYGRETKGTVEVSTSMYPTDCGDEPLLLKINHPKTVVLVDEDRSRGLDYLHLNYPKIEKVILDDAMQHRKIKPSFTFLLTTWRRPFFDDHLIPAGNLRDIKSRRNAANAVIITKKPNDVKDEELRKMKSLAGIQNQPVFVSGIRYINLYGENNEVVSLASRSKVVLLTGIANTKELADQVASQFEILKHFKYADHHQFSEKELYTLREFIDTFGPEKPSIVTTEKDWQRLAQFKDFFVNEGIQILHWKIEVDFGQDAKSIEELIRSI